jgi:hypothetical protein
MKKDHYVKTFFDGIEVPDFLIAAVTLVLRIIKNCYVSVCVQATVRIGTVEGAVGRLVVDNEDFRFVTRVFPDSSAL